MKKSNFQTINDYILTFPKDVRVILENVRQIIKKETPGAVETISYQMPTFKLNDKNLVHFAGYKNHIGFYPAPAGIDAFSKELSLYKQGRGSVQFPIDKPLPFKLIAKIVKFRVEETIKIMKK